MNRFLSLLTVFSICCCYCIEISSGAQHYDLQPHQHPQQQLQYKYGPSQPPSSGSRASLIEMSANEEMASPLSLNWQVPVPISNSQSPMYNDDRFEYGYDFQYPQRQQQQMYRSSETRPLKWSGGFDQLPNTFNVRAQNIFKDMIKEMGRQKKWEPIHSIKEAFDFHKASSEPQQNNYHVVYAGEENRQSQSAVTGKATRTTTTTKTSPTTKMLQKQEQKQNQQQLVDKIENLRFPYDKKQLLGRDHYHFYTSVATTTTFMKTAFEEIESKNNTSTNTTNATTTTEASSLLSSLKTVSFASGWGECANLDAIMLKFDIRVMSSQAVDNYDNDEILATEPKMFQTWCLLHNDVLIVHFKSSTTANDTETAPTPPNFKDDHKLYDWRFEMIFHVEKENEIYRLNMAKSIIGGKTTMYKKSQKEELKEEEEKNESIFCSEKQQEENEHQQNVSSLDLEFGEHNLKTIVKCYKQPIRHEFLKSFMPKAFMSDDSFVVVLVTCFCVCVFLSLAGWLLAKRIRKLYKMRTSMKKHRQFF